MNTLDRLTLPDDTLARTLVAAYTRAMTGKGRRHHDGDVDFEQQPIMRIQEMVGVGFPLGQIMKKAAEARRLHGGDAVDELHDIIIYAAAAAIYLSGMDVTPSCSDVGDPDYPVYPNTDTIE